MVHFSLPIKLALLLLAVTVIQSADGHESIALDAIDVRTHYYNGMSISDASEGKVNASLIQNRLISRSGEVLEFVPGMIVTPHSGIGKANQYFLRGFN